MSCSNWESTGSFLTRGTWWDYSFKKIIPVSNIERVGGYDNRNKIIGRIIFLIRAIRQQ